MKVLETGRLILRPWKIEDVDDFYEYAKNPNVGLNAGWQPHDVCYSIVREEYLYK